MLEYAALILVSFIVTYVFTYMLIPRLKRFNLTGKDINKPDTPEVAEMGGIAIVAGFTAGVLIAVFMNTFLGFSFNLVYILAALITIHSIAFIGIVDDLLDIPQWFKAFLPLVAAVPLIAVKAAGSTELAIPFLGTVNLGILYIFILIPIGIAVASNLTNMLAGFNGMESGMGMVIFAAMAIIALSVKSPEMLVLFIPMLGALAAFFLFNRYPAKVFPGDVGNLTIGAVLASGVIIGNIESAGAILMVPYVVDFFLKLYNRFPSRNWWGVYKNGKLYPVENKVRGFAQLVMKKANGISEQNLSLFFIALEGVFAAIAVALFVLKV
jgi:UDP-N-acetylglucosamine--dolichyl-phosphate N-acetylglucosaminephosphotransferase